MFKKQTVKAVDLIYGEDVMKLYLCEKPSQGRDVAVELNATKRADGYFLMNADGSIVVTWGIGHLVGRLKTECFYGREFKTREEIVDAVRDYLDYYNHRRIQLKLKGLSPIQYRKQSFE